MESGHESLRGKRRHITIMVNYLSTMFFTKMENFTTGAVFGWLA